MRTVEHVVVNNQLDLQRAITPYQVSGKARDILVQGLTELRQQYTAYLQALRELEETAGEMGGYAPAKPTNPLTGRHWIDDIIQKRLGGKRDGLLVKWTFSTECHTWDPITKDLNKC